MGLQGIRKPETGSDGIRRDQKGLGLHHVATAPTRPLCVYSGPGQRKRIFWRIFSAPTQIKIVTKKPALHGTITKTGWNFFTTTVFCSKLEVNPESAFQSGFIRL